MQWGTFSITHIVSLLLSVGFTLGMHFVFRNRSKRTKKIFLVALSVPGLISIVWNMLQWGTPLEYLPLHMCAITLILLPVTVIKESNVLGNLLLLFGLGAVLALVVNTAQGEYELWSIAFITYYFPHTFEFAACILLFTLGITKFKLKYILTTVGLTFGIFTVVHFINLGLNAYCAANELINPSGELIQVNYMFSYYPDNPLLSIFYKVIPYKYWYMLLAVPIIIIYLLIIYNISYFIKKIKM